MVNFYIPDFVNNAVAICLLADLMEGCPQWFYEDSRISAAYGSFGSCIWNGGRVFLARNDSRDMEKIIKSFNDRNIAVRYTFTNPLIEEKHLNDTFGNLCLELANNGMNEVIVNVPILEQYIRENYPNFRLISSTTKCINTLDGLKNELEKDYYLVVADSVWNNTDELFALENKEKIELIINHACRDNCPMRKVHYNDIGNSVLNFRSSSFVCPNKVYEATFNDLKAHKNFISIEDIHGRYKEAGFHHMKMDGRSFTPNTLVENLAYYLVKPEFQEKVKSILFKEVYNKLNLTSY